ncbi:hypothetical protein BH23BAC1_BH23BAC1_17830 [soil metagenome]
MLLLFNGFQQILLGKKFKNPEIYALAMTMKEKFLGICEEIVNLTIELLKANQINDDLYQIVSLLHVFHNGTSIWNVILKNKHLIPDSPDQAIGAGGEIFIEVNLATGKAKITGYGE